jgi:hypothetical protein
MATGNMLVNEPSPMWIIGFMSPGFVDPLVPGKLGTEVPTQVKANETWVTGKQFVEAPRTIGNEMAWFQGTRRPRDIDDEETTQRGTITGPITSSETVV